MAFTTLARSRPSFTLGQGSGAHSAGARARTGAPKEQLAVRSHVISALRKLWSGDLAPLGGPALEAAVAGRVRAEQIGMIKRYLPLMMLANASNALVLVAALWSSPARDLSLFWASGIVCFSAFLGLRGWRAGAKAPKSVSERTIRRAVRNAFVLGAMWAVAPLVFFADAEGAGRFVIGCLCAGMLCGGAFAFSTIPAAALAYIAPISLGCAVGISRAEESGYLLVVLLLVAYAAVLLRGVFVHAMQMTARLVQQVNVEEEARTDALTHLSNRVSFDEKMRYALARLDRYEEGFAVLYIDLDDFKAVNDKWGHAAGDELLIHAASRLRACAREGDAVARLSGDEFAIIAPEIDNAKEARAVADRVIRTLDAPFPISYSQISVSASIGIALAPRDGTDPETLLKHADTALYCAKRGSGGAVQFFNLRQNVDSKERRALEYDLRAALERNEFFLLYQPILSVADDRIAGFEALLRWRHPRRGVVPPADFIRLAEETGLIHAIGDWAMREACRVASAWPRTIKIAVNVSAVQFRRAEFLRTVVEALAEFNLAPSQLEVEVTESVLMADDDVAVATAASLNELGASLALDDFGVGFSSLTYLRKLPLRKIKIDRSFIHDLSVRADSAAIVKFVIGLAAELGMRVTAEGVETAAQAEHLRAVKCSEIQGYLVARPMAAAEAAAFIAKASSETKVA